MRKQPHLWTTLLSNLGIRNQKRRSRSTSSRHRKLHFEHCEDRRMLAPFMVTNNDDAIENTPEAIGTLRQAIFDANQFPDVDEIYFAASLDGTPIVLTQGELSIINPVTIKAAVDGTTTQTLDITIDASGNDSKAVPVAGDGDGSRVFDISLFSGSDEDKDVVLAGLTITGGDGGTGGGINFYGFSSNGPIGIATLTIRDSTITGNHALGNGGGINIYSYRPKAASIATSVVIERSIISDNRATLSSSLGGGIYMNVAGSNAEISETKITGNTTNGKGGGLYAFPHSRDDIKSEITISKSTISGNIAGSDGGGRINAHFALAV